MKLTQYFSTNGFPTSKLALTIFANTFGLEFHLELLHEQEKKAVRNIDTANIEKLIDIHQSISSNTDSSKVFVLLKQLSEGDKEVYYQLKALLLSEPKELEKLLNAVIESDKINNTHHYETLKHTLLSIDPTFQVLLDDYETSKRHDTLSFPKAYVYSLS